MKHKQRKVNRQTREKRFKIHYRGERKRWGGDRVWRRGALQHGFFELPTPHRAEQCYLHHIKDSRSTWNHHGTRIQEAYRAWAKRKRSLLG